MKLLNVSEEGLEKPKVFQKKLIALLAILTLVLIGCKDAKITGDVIADVEIETEEACTDTDRGINQEVKGVVTIDGEDYEDQCIAGLLVEYYCKDNQKENQNFQCKNKCINGKCV